LRLKRKVSGKSWSKNTFLLYLVSNRYRPRTHLVYAPEATLGHDFQVVPGARYQRGQIIARGAIDTGDQVFVDKFIYNFMKPHRGDVFVFRTKHIPMIPEDPQTGAPLLYQASGWFGG